MQQFFQGGDFVVSPLANLQNVSAAIEACIYQNQTKPDHPQQFLAIYISNI
jgi:hypothetical protein